MLNQVLALGLRNTAHRYISGRLTKTMFRVLENDPTNGRGERRVPEGLISILQGFNFNRDTSLQNVLRAPYSVIFDQEAMLVTISFPSFIPKAMIDTASGANAFMLTAIAAPVHFETEGFPVEPVQTEILDLSLQLHEHLQLQMPVIDHEADHTVIVALGIEFFRNIYGTIEPVDKIHNALAVIKVF